MLNPVLASFDHATNVDNGRKGAMARWHKSPLNPVKHDRYVERRLARVRRQLDRIDGMMLTEVDPKNLNNLAAASMRLADQERKLAGRPDPGSYRPVAPKPKSSGGVMPVEE